MKMVVGLGNPGKKYENTRHNTGYMILDTYLEKDHPTWKKKYQSLYYEKNINGEKVLFIKPETYMNESGKAVFLFSQFYKISPKDILILCDDLDQNLGKFRLRDHGSCGGHNGLRSIEQSLKTDEYKRLRIGISTPKKEEIDIVSYVLGFYSNDEITILKKTFPICHQIIDDYLKLDFQELMNKYNRRK